MGFQTTGISPERSEERAGGSSSGASDAADCLGCRTVAGSHAADEVYRDPWVVAVVALHAVNPGHIVIVTCEHARNVFYTADALFTHIMLVARDLGQALMTALPCPAVMIMLNNERPCQSLLHTHVHVVPRLPGDGMDRRFDVDVSPEERAATAWRLRPALSTVRRRKDDP